jgi:hypothetical protein
MSEQEARKYTSIRNLREEIRQDMRDYQMLCSDDHEGDPYFPFINAYCWFRDYLKQKINDNLIKLKELVEQNNE